MGKTVVVTDGKYRASIAAVRMLGRAGFRVVVTQCRDTSPAQPPVFASRYASECHWIPGAETDPEYPDRLFSLLEACEHPVVLCVGAASLNALSWQRERFRQVCDFLISPPAVLDSLNDKAAVHRRCLHLGIPVPRQYTLCPDRFPVVVKPRCGERFGWKAARRYRIAEDQAAWEKALADLAPWDPEPVVQEYVQGAGMGVSVLMGSGGILLGALCHRRVREYPISGGPSACCESVYDPERITQAARLLRSFHFQGLAMVEWKGDKVLEVNPRIWGSFPLTEKTGSPLAVNYARAAAGEAVDYAARDYKTGVRMRFLLNDSAALLSLLRHGRFRDFFSGLPDCFRAEEALSSRDDPAPMRRYLRNISFRMV